MTRFMSTYTSCELNYSDYQANFKSGEALIKRLDIVICSDADRFNQELSFECILLKDAADPKIVVKGTLPGADQFVVPSGCYTDYKDEWLTYIKNLTPLVIAIALKHQESADAYVCSMYLYGALTREQYEEKKKSQVS